MDYQKKKKNEKKNYPVYYDIKILIFLIHKYKEDYF